MKSRVKGKVAVKRRPRAKKKVNLPVITAVIHGPDPAVVRAVPVPIEKAKEPGFWASLFGIEHK